MKVIKELLDKQVELKEKFRQQGKKALATAFKEVFDDYPQVESIRWSQYTPYFNDGDACYFGRNDFTIRLLDEKEGAGDYEDGYRDEFDQDLPKVLRELLRDLDKNLSGDAADELFLDLFGDHVQVTATRTGFTTEAYEHE